MVIIIFDLKHFRPKTYSRPVGPVKPGFLSILVSIFFEINIMMAIRVFILFKIWCSIRIQNQISKKKYLN
jgi:hypothetical protein